MFARTPPLTRSLAFASIIFRHSAVSRLPGRALHHSSISQSYAPLPILNAVKLAIKKDARLFAFDHNTIFICVQHGLSSTVDLFEAMIELGARPENIFWLGKSYSNNPEVVKRLQRLNIHVYPASKQLAYGAFQPAFTNDVANLWAQLRLHLEARINPTQIIILDDGGACLAQTPADLYEKHTIVGIEQTSHGVNGNTKALPLPVINVAQSALKEHLESPLIAEALMKNMQALLDKEGLQYGSAAVIGYGKIGRAITELFIKSGVPVWVYDKNPKKLEDLPEGAKKCSHFATALGANLIVGCTGTDITADDSNFEALMQAVGAQKILASCSSSDVEFRRLLQTIQEQLESSLSTRSFFDTLTYQPKDGAKISVLRGGTPINFNGGPDSVPREQIQIIRAALLAATSYAKLLANEIEKKRASNLPLDCERRPNMVQLPAPIQQFIAKTSRKYLPPDLAPRKTWHLFAKLDRIVAASEPKLIIDETHQNLLESAFYLPEPKKRPQAAKTASLLSRQATDLQKIFDIELK